MQPRSRAGGWFAFALRRRALWLAIGLAAFTGVAVALGCNNACIRSQDREIECVGSRTFDAGSPIDCTLTDECFADCVNDAGCDQVIAYLEVAAEAGAPSEEMQRKAQGIFDCRKVCQAPTPIPQ
jgi:hypothetical protein